MVYCGKPSKGCQSCRERKTRCDQATPRCSQCTRLDRKCEYRNLLDLSFRNESSAVIEKAKVRATAKSRPRQAPRTVKSKAGTASFSILKSPSPASVPATTGDWSPIVVHDQTQHVTPPDSDREYSDAEDYCISMTEYTLFPSSDELAAGFFTRNFVTARTGSSRGNFTYLEELHRQRGGFDDIVTTSINSVGLAGLSNTTKSPSFMRQARKEYASALRQVNSALQSPSQAIQDVTLVSIMILSVFENITATGQVSLKAWTEHVNGAAALVKLRGVSQFKTSIGRSLFFQVSAHLLTSCVQREIPIPSDILELRAEATNYVDPTEASWMSLNSIADFTIFRGAVKDGTLKDPESIIAAALKIDNNFVRTFSNLPPVWQYETIFTDAYPELIYNGSYDVYEENWTPQVWNGMRTCRILLHEVIREKLLAGFTSTPALFTDVKYTAQLQKSTETLIKMRDDILHTLPQQLGYVARGHFSQQAALDAQDFTFYHTDSTPNPQFSNGITSPLFSNKSHEYPFQSLPPGHPAVSPLVRAAGGYFILWPLLVCGIIPITSEDTRSFIINRLHYISETMGIMQGNALAALLEDRGFSD